MKKLLFKLFDNMCEGIDTYYNDGSMWLIFTDDKKWVIELTKNGTLWYNYYFFENCYKYVSLDVVKNQHYITEWVESIIQNGVRFTRTSELPILLIVESIIQNGVKSTNNCTAPPTNAVESIIKNAVRSTEDSIKERTFFVEDTIQNGVKSTNRCAPPHTSTIETVIQNGIKHTEYGDWLDDDKRLNNILQNGIKETN